MAKAGSNLMEETKDMKSRGVTASLHITGPHGRITTPGGLPRRQPQWECGKARLRGGAMSRQLISIRRSMGAKETEGQEATRKAREHRSHQRDP